MSPLVHLTAEQWPAASALLDEALALDPTERDTFVQQLDGERAQYRETLRALLAQAAGVDTDDFLATLPRVTGFFDRAADALTAGTLTELAADQSIGPYRLIRELGVGGMGAVWLAERADGSLKRRVALKLPRLAWGKALGERMVRERDILASLEHPHIARLYDAGVDQHGRPYLALEYVEGQPIDVYAKERALSVKHKLDLLLQVCAAVAFAHSRLVVHRDLKPSNILVTVDGQVRLLDFGIAKLMEGDRTQETQLTQLAGRALTLDYASPEQIKGEPIGTASDVYSLGVVAYELLTEAKPYRLKRGSAAELEEAIATADVPQASDAASEPQSKRALRGDLDAILNKALKKAPADRYPTIDALAQDLTRHLNSEPVSAQPDAFAYRAGKFLRRHRVQAGAGIAVLSALAVGLTAALWQAAEAERERAFALQSRDEAQFSRAQAQDLAVLADAQRRRADESLTLALQREKQLEVALTEAGIARRQAELAAAEAAASGQLAQQEARRAKAVKDFLVGVFESSDIDRMPADERRGRTVQALLEDGARRVEADFATEPELRAELQGVIGRLLIGLRLHVPAVEALQGQLRAQDELGASPRERAGTLRQLAQQLAEAGDHAGASRSFDSAIGLVEGRQDRADI